MQVTRDLPPPSRSRRNTHQKCGVNKPGMGGMGGPRPPGAGKSLGCNRQTPRPRSEIAGHPGVLSGESCFLLLKIRPRTGGLTSAWQARRWTLQKSPMEVVRVLRRPTSVLASAGTPAKSGRPRQWHFEVEWQTGTSFLSRKDSITRRMLGWPATSGRGQAFTWRTSCTCPRPEVAGHLLVPGFNCIADRWSIRNSLLSITLNIAGAR
jgi:hypothetical protein